MVSKTTPNKLVTNAENNERKLVKTFPIALVISRYNENITQLMREQALEHLECLGFTPHEIQVFMVPGAREIPLIAQTLASLKRVEAIVALGAVIRGDTTHYDYVCQQVSDGCLRIMLDYSLPVIFGILTTENEQQALDRLNGKCGWKAREAIDAACEMVNLQHSLL